MKDQPSRVGGNRWCRVTRRESRKLWVLRAASECDTCIRHYAGETGDCVSALCFRRQRRDFGNVGCMSGERLVLRQPGVVES